MDWRVIGMIKRKDKWLTLMEDNRKAVEIYGHAKISRKQAKEAGLKFYWSGEICLNGHLTYRYTSSCSCRQCNMDNLAEYNDYVDETDKHLKKKRDLLFEKELRSIEKDLDYLD